MSTYNLSTKDGRDKLRADSQSVLDAIEAGTWPRTLDELYSFGVIAPLTDPKDPYRVEREHAAKMARLNLNYCVQKDGGGRLLRGYSK